MKKLTLLTAACLTVTLTTQALVVPTIPIVSNPIVKTMPAAFILTLIAQGMVSMEEALCEPLGNYEVGIQHMVGYATSTTSWPSWVYPTRMIDAERSYDKDPATGRSWWWFKTVWTVENRDGSETTEITYSQTPPSPVQWNIEDVKYTRFPVSANDSQFQWASMERLIGYAKRLGSRAWGLPIVCIFQGINWTPVWRNDYLYHTPISPYLSRRYVFLGPSALGSMSYTIFPLDAASPDAEVNSTGAGTYYLNQ